MAQHLGRHRAPDYSPLSEIADIAARSAQPAMKVSAVAVASGGLVATFALPASAAPGHEDSAVTTAAGAPVSTLPQIAGQTVAVAAPAVDNAVAPTFGVVGFTVQPAAAAAPQALTITKVAQAAPAASPAAAPAAAPTTRASRTTTRTAAPAAAPAVNAAPAPAATGGIIGIAASLSGIAYRYGGTTTAGFDCSGFTGYVYRLAGKSIPRTAAAQQAAATKVSNPAPGDLIFFGYPAYHVGIYAGGGMMYDSPHTGSSTGLHAIWTQKGVSYGRF
ncbi:MAG TPA: C40 family peptidase [Lapillicoccus sp.]|uniref:C40 family peptidase n=1 Tax=Lapillicoccus sp. TaxID=1909287 RepID=UPI002F93BC79